MITKRYLISSAVTFFAGFAGIILLNLDAITLESFNNGIFVGILLAALRGGIKAVVEFFVAKFSK